MIPLGFFDPTMLLLIPPMLLLAYAQMKVKSTFSRYSEQSSSSGATGADIARRILRDNGLDDIPVEQTQGRLTDHYDPSDRVLRLSESTYGSRSLAAVGVAAHEAGHAVQDAQGYTPMKLRQGLAPAASFGNNLGFIIFFVGMLMSLLMGMVPAGSIVMKTGIGLFALGTFFTVLTLPVEFNASSRALAALEHGGYVTTQEKEQAEEVLNAAALTYVASAFMAAMMLLRLILLFLMASRE